MADSSTGASGGASNAEKVKVRDLADKRSPTRLAGRYAFEDLRTNGEVTADWTVQPETAGLSIRGHLHGVLLLECARCLSEYPLPVDIDLNERYVFESYTDPYEREKELQAEDFFEVVSEEGELDLKDLAHQFLVMESVNHPTCNREECSFVQAG